MHWYSRHPIFDYDNVKFLAQSLVQATPLLVLSGVRSWLTAPWEWPILGYLVAVQLLLYVLLPRHRIFAMLVLTGSLCAIVISALNGRPLQFRVCLRHQRGGSLHASLPVRRRYSTPFPSKGGVDTLLGLTIFAGARTIEGHRELVATATAYRAALSEAKPYFSGTIISWGAA